MTIKCYGCGKELHGIFGHPHGEPLFCSFECQQKRAIQGDEVLRKMRAAMNLTALEETKLINGIRALHSQSGSFCNGCDGLGPVALSRSSTGPPRNEATNERNRTARKNRTARQHAEIARLTAERDEWKGKVEEAQREMTRIVGLFRALANKINTDGHHPFANAIEAVCALVEASKGESNG